jgi:hypothetical protein
MLQVSVGVLFLLIGALLDGMLAILLVGVIARTGVPNSFAVGQAQQEEVRPGRCGTDAALCLALRSCGDNRDSQGRYRI